MSFLNHLWACLYFHFHNMSFILSLLLHLRENVAKTWTDRKTFVCYRLTFLQAHVIKMISINISDLFTKSCLQHFNVLVYIRRSMVIEHDIPNLYTFVAFSASVEYIIVYKCFPDGISISIFHPNFAK